MRQLIQRHGRKFAAATAVSAALAVGTALPAHAAPTVYRITTVATLAVDVAGSSSDSGAAVIQWPINNGQNQEWTLVGKSYGSWLVNYRTGKCLSVSGASTSAGAPLVQYPCGDVAHEEWALEPVNSGTAYVLRNANSHQVIDVPGGTGNWGTQLEQWPSNGNPNQYFWFQSVA
ncbi:RICIN domain-containing protein [Amycolatopsis mongoliensis]|uniref:RICIN domain-containing protein n=1 Tax=Amycolatopsis mongoliensis TaxID=715475 RepID=A0A9Y2JIS4_9PSEU|nr:RICIN domain-containing protein [Amycolatopsis sp. 4-36]WIX98494.1 RICIN domain-containing protein [Amycolatopsis sp. 4-36]